MKLSKEKFVKFFETLEKYIWLQKILEFYGYGISDDNAGNNFVTAAIEVLKEELPERVRKEELIEEYCWNKEFCFDDQYMVYKVKEDIKKIDTPEDLYDLIAEIAEEEK